MNFLEAIVLGIIQGATEFLPVSSSGHSVLVPAILGLDAPDLNAVVVAHLGTLLAVLLYFYRDIIAIARAVLTAIARRDLLGTADARLGWYLLVGTVPAAAVGLLLNDYFEQLFADPRWAAGFLLVTAGLLITGERLLSGRKSLAEMGWSDALFIGVAQVVALFPGVSRSGTTIVAGLLRGLDRPTAARYSFLLSVPVILGAGVIQVPQIFANSVEAAHWPMFLVTFFTAFVVGYGCIALLLNWLRRHSLYPFAVYCALLGTIYLLVAFL